MLLCAISVRLGYQRGPARFSEESGGGAGGVSSVNICWILSVKPAEPGVFVFVLEDFCFNYQFNVFDPYKTIQVIYFFLGKCWLFVVFKESVHLVSVVELMGTN